MVFKARFPYPTKRRHSFLHGVFLSLRCPVSPRTPPQVCLSPDSRLPTLLPSLLVEPCHTAGTTLAPLRPPSFWSRKPTPAFAHGPIGAASAPSAAAHLSPLLGQSPYKGSALGHSASTSHFSPALGLPLASPSRPLLLSFMHNFASRCEALLRSAFVVGQ